MPESADMLTMCLFDEAGEVLASNIGHARMLGRSSDQIVGQNWRAWTPTAHLSAAEATYARVVAGNPTEFLRKIIRPDGSVALGQSYLFSTTRFNRPLVIGTMRLVHAKADQPIDGAYDLADYVNGLTAELAEMADRTGLHSLSKKLYDVARDAGEVASALRADQSYPH